MSLFYSAGLGGAIPDTQIQRPTDNNTGNSAQVKLGPEIAANVDFDGLKADLSAGTSGASTAYILDDSESVIASTDISGLGSGEEFSITQSLSSGQTYYLVIDNGGNSYDFGSYDASGQYPYNGDAFDVVDGYSGGAAVSDRFFALNNIRNLNY